MSGSDTSPADMTVTVDLNEDVHETSARVLGSVYALTHCVEVIQENPDLEMSDRAVESVVAGWQSGELLLEHPRFEEFLADPIAVDELLKAASNVLVVADALNVTVEFDDIDGDDTIVTADDPAETTDQEEP